MPIILGKESIMSTSSSGRKVRKARIASLAFLVGTSIAIIPISSANAAYDQSAGSNNCGSPVSFMKSNSNGNVFHYQNTTTLVAHWSNFGSYITRVSNHPGVISGLRVRGTDSPPWIAELAWVQKGCGQG